MIHDIQELAGSLRYMASWTDALEGMRRSAMETGDALLPITSGGPLSEVRRVLAEAREFVNRLAMETAPDDMEEAA